MKNANTDPLTRILSRVRICFDGCWVYMGARVHGDRGRYGKAKVNGKVVRVHRYVYSRLYGDAPPLLDHLCRRRPCCNPGHQQGSTVKQNTRDGLSGCRRAACPWTST